MQRVESTILKGLLVDQLKSQKVCQDSAFHVGEALVQTSLRGVDSHGINLFPHYSGVVETKRINANPHFSTLRQSASVALFDADHAFGHHASAEAMQLAMGMAKKSGMGAVAIANSSHFAAAAYYALMAAEEGYLGFAFTNADSLVKAFGSKEPFFGTNPICLAAPMEGETPFCLDMATSAIPWNRINNFRRSNTPLPPDVAFDSKGEMITDPHLAASLAPTGGYKGFGLGMMVEILCGLLTGGPVARELIPMYQKLESRRSISHFVMALDISHFIDLEAFKVRLKHMADEVRRLPRDSASAVMIPGDPEKRSFELRSRDGIPVDDLKFQEFLAINPKFSEAVIK